MDKFYQAAGWCGEAPEDYCGYRLLDVAAENDRVKLIPYIDEYFDLHLKVRLELYPDITSIIAGHDGMRAGYRRMLIEESRDLKMLVFDAPSSELVGEVIAQPACEGIIELGWDILPKYRRMGYATSATVLFMHLLGRREDCRGFIAAIEAGNEASKALARKLGGVPSTTRPVFQAHQGLPTDGEIGEAAAFGVSPERLLDHALIFAIPKPLA